MIEKVEKYVRQQHMWDYGAHIVAGISGGADSVCLLLVLLSLRDKWGLRLTAVHVHHGLRGSDADADEAFVKKLCMENQVDFRSFRVDASAEAARRKISEEEAGRELRREIFEHVREEVLADVIALAHHKNDNVETFLFRLCRGSGLEGLCGIRPVNGRIVHPLLCVSRKEIEEFLEEKKQPYCTDKTNFENAYSRNKIRNQLIPFLRDEINEGSEEHISETMLQFLDIQEYLTKEMARIEKDCVIRRGDTLLIVEKEYRNLPDIMKKMLLKDCLIRVSGHRRDIGNIHVEALCELMGLQCGRERYLPYQVLAVRTYDGVVLKNMSEVSRVPEGEKSTFDELLEKLPDKDGNLPVPCDLGWIRTRVFERPENMRILEKTFTKWFDYDIIKYSLQIRTRRPGDYLVVDRSGNRQKLKSYFINEKIPKEERDKLLLLADGSHILWVIGHRMSMAGQVRESTQRILEIQITEEMEKWLRQLEY